MVLARIIIFANARHFERWLLLGWLLLSDVEQVKNLVVILLTLSKSKKLAVKLLWEKLDAYAFFSFFGPLPHVTGTPPWLLRPKRVSTSSELYPDTWLFLNA